MTTDFDSFDESPLGAFVESPLGARNAPAIPTGPGTYAWIQLLVIGQDGTYNSGAAYRSWDLTQPSQFKAWWDEDISYYNLIGVQRPLLIRRGMLCSHILLDWNGGDPYPFTSTLAQLSGGSYAEAIGLVYAQLPASRFDEAVWLPWYPTVDALVGGVVGMLGGIIPPTIILTNGFKWYDGWWQDDPRPVLRRLQELYPNSTFQFSGSGGSRWLRGYW